MAQSKHEGSGKEAENEAREFGGGLLQRAL